MPPATPRSADPLLDPGEALESLVLPLPEVVRLARAGALLQSLHVAGLFLALAEAGQPASD